MFQSPLRVRHLRCADARTQDSILMTDATVPIAIVSVPAPAPTLRRELGRWNLTAIGVNQVIGSAVFILPSQVAAQLGNWSPIAFLLVGFASLLVALCFAEVGSRFDGTGGAYACRWRRGRLAARHLVGVPRGREAMHRLCHYFSRITGSGIILAE
jgi:hypothetical protein